MMAPNFSEARVRAVMRMERLGFREACAWLGRRGAMRRNLRARHAKRVALIQARQWPQDFSE